MSAVYTGATMSLDGYIAGPGETGFDPFFKWYGNGDVVMPTSHEDLTFQLSPASAEHLRHFIDITGVPGRPSSSS
jgi:hypothetical protein